MDGDRDFFEREHEDFRSAVRQFVDREVAGRLDEWDERRIIDRATWLSAGKHGLLGFAVPERLGGGGTADYRFRCVLAEELAAVGAASLNSGFALRARVQTIYGGATEIMKLLIARDVLGKFSFILLLASVGIR